MNETIRLLQSHRSIRKYTADPVTDAQLDAILRSAQMASSSSAVQAYSVIAVRDQELKNNLAELAGGQAYVAECPVFLVWCADLYRLEQTSRMHAGDEAKTVSSTENFIVATVDAALAAQNAAVAAESLGLGIVYIGGIRNRIAEVSELLHLPRLVYPVFGMCIGTPDQQPILRPRLPQRAVVHKDRYDPSVYPEAIAEYDETIREYMRERSGGRMSSTWSEAMASKMTKQVRMHMKEYLKAQGFDLL